MRSIEDWIATVFRSDQLLSCLSGMPANRQGARSDLCESNHLILEWAKTAPSPDDKPL